MLKKIKILLTIPNFETAGSTKVLYDLAKRLDHNKFDIAIACDHNRGAFFKEVEALGFPIYIIKTTVVYRPYISLWFRLHPIVTFFKKEQFDIIHSWHWSSDWTEAIAARRAGAKYIFTKKAMSWGNQHWKIRSFLAHFIITINHEMRSYFPYKKQQKLIPLGIDTTYYTPEIFPKKKESNIFKIITVANLVPVKGVEVLIKAVHLLEDPSVILTIVGGGDSGYVKTLKNLSNTLGLESQVQFLGSKPDVRPFIVFSDVYVIPTLNEGRKEGMPMALVEAMSMGIPVLGSRISGINFVLKDFPELLFEASNVEQLADKLNDIKHRGFAGREELGNALRAYCVSHFTLEKFIKESEAIYFQLVKPKGS